MSEQINDLDAIINDHMRKRAEIMLQSHRGDITPEAAYLKLRELLREDLCHRLTT